MGSQPLLLGKAIDAIVCEVGSQSLLLRPTYAIGCEVCGQPLLLGFGIVVLLPLSKVFTTDIVVLILPLCVRVCVCVRVYMYADHMQ